jgi:hypothetical protein
MRHRAKRLAYAVAAVVSFTIGCASTVPPPGGRLTASQQLLTTEAIDRALAQLDWPDFHGRSVFVDIGSTAAPDERHYLESAVTAAVAQRGAKITPELKSADFAVIVLGKALGVDQKDTFFGIPAIQSALLPVGLPEIAFYKASEQKGVAKLETVVADRKQRQVSHSGVVESQTWVRDKRILVFNLHDANAPELQTPEH